MVEADTKFAAEYTHDGARWALNFYAKDEADAISKLGSIRRTLTLLGETVFIGNAESFVVPDKGPAH
jgi:hypothetical protein